MAKESSREKLKEAFREKLLRQVHDLNSAVATKTGDWIIKGFIDIAKNISKDMAKTVDLERPPYKNLEEYRRYKKLCAQK